MLGELQVELLERLDPLDRRGDAPVHVRVDPDLHVVADAVANRRERVVVLREVAADLQLQLGVSGLDEVGGLLRVRGRIVDEQVADHRDALASDAAEQLRDRNPERLPLQIEEGELEPRDRVGRDSAPVARVLLHPVHEPFDPERVLADHELRELAIDDSLDRR